MNRPTEFMDTVFSTMRLLILILCFTLLEGSPSGQCRSALDGCSRRTLTHGACGNSLYRMQYDAIRHDINRDCYVTSTDVEEYARRFLDQDGDNQVCRSEYIDAEKERYSYSEKMLTEIWDQNYGGKDCVSVSNFYNSDQKILLGSYVTNMVTLYSQYCGRGPNLRDDVLSCSIIVNLCKYEYRDLPACVNFMSHNPPREHRKTLWEKINLHTADLDRNLDGISTAEEIGWFDSTMLDTDNDGCAEMEESVIYWLDTYNLTEAFTRYALERVADLNNNNCFDIGDFSFIPPEGGPANLTTLAMVRQVGEMCEADQSVNNFLTNVDCAGVAFLCKQRLPNQEQCSNYVNCGLPAYSECASQLKQTNDCFSEEDKRYIDAERRSVDSIIVRFCTPDGSGNDAGSQLFATWSAHIFAITMFLQFTY